MRAHTMTLVHWHCTPCLLVKQLVQTSLCTTLPTLLYDRKVYDCYWNFLLFCTNGRSTKGRLRLYNHMHPNAIKGLTIALCLSPCHTSKYPGYCRLVVSLKLYNLVLQSTDIIFLHFTVRSWCQKATSRLFKTYVSWLFFLKWNGKAYYSYHMHDEFCDWWCWWC